MYKTEFKNLCQVFKLAIPEGQKKMANLRTKFFLSYFHMKFNYLKVHIFLNMSINKKLKTKKHP